MANHPMVGDSHQGHLERIGAAQLSNDEVLGLVAVGVVGERLDVDLTDGVHVVGRFRPDDYCLGHTDSLPPPQPPAEPTDPTKSTRGAATAATGAGRCPPS